MADAERRKCKCCHKLFRPDPRNRHHQRYCAAPSCRAAAPENQDYFRGAVNVARVKEWRSRNPGYWRKRPSSRVALQELSFAQALDSKTKKANFADLPLQEVLSAQPAVLIGLIAHLTGTPQQDELARTTDRLLRLGQDILATSTARDGPAP